MVKFFIELQRKEKGSLPGHSLVLQRGICGLPSLSVGNTSNTMRNVSAVGGECPVLSGTLGVTLSGVECLHTSSAAWEGSAGKQGRIWV